jgi:hypothetical protein
VGLIDDSAAARIEEGLAARTPEPTVARWMRALLDDRKARSALILRLARQLHHARRRLRQAAAYLDGLLAKAHEDAREPWPDKTICESCGAPLDRVRTTPRTTSGHRLTNEHPDGTKCHGTDQARDVPRDGPSLG